MIKYLVLALAISACGGIAVDPPAVCTQVGSSYTWGKGTTLRYECDSDPGENCTLRSDGQWECPKALTQAVIVCPQ